MTGSRRGSTVGMLLLESLRKKLKPIQDSVVSLLPIFHPSPKDEAQKPKVNQLLGNEFCIPGLS